MEREKQLRESDIRPQDAHAAWRDLVQNDLAAWEHEGVCTEQTHCPGCGSEKTHEAFTVFSFPYRECALCGSMFSSRRPSPHAVQTFYQSAPSMQFLKEHIVAPTRSVREREHLAPLGKWVSGVIKNYLPDAKTVAEYQPKFYSIFTNEALFSGFNRTVVSPLHFLEPHALFEKRELSEVEGTIDVLAAFDSIDREVHPKDFLQTAAQRQDPGGLLFLTGNTGSGFEYQVLGAHAARLVPPDRLNLLSVEAIRGLVEDAGYRVIDVSTPSALDVEIVANAVKDNPDIVLPPFVRYMLTHRDESTWHSLQSFLRLNNLGAVVRLAAIKQ